MDMSAETRRADDEAGPSHEVGRPLATRHPSGRCPWPMVLLEGPEKSGKTFAALSLSACPKVGPLYAFDLGEGSLDEYAPLGPFRIVDYDGSYGGLLCQLQQVLALPVDPVLPTVIVLDGIGSLWAMLCEEAAESARRSPAGLRLLGSNADAEVPISMDKWQIAKRKWRAVIDLLLGFPGIVVLTCRGREIPSADNAEPPRDGRREWRIEAEKSLGFDCSAWVRMRGPGVADLIGARSLTLMVPAGGAVLLEGFTLERLLFEVLGLSSKTSGARQITQLRSAGALADDQWFAGWQHKASVATSVEELTQRWHELVDAGRAGRVGPERREIAVALLAQAKQALAAASPDGKQDSESTVDESAPVAAPAEQDASRAAVPTGFEGAGRDRPAQVRSAPGRKARATAAAPSATRRRAGKASAPDRVEALQRLAALGEPETVCVRELGVPSEQVPVAHLGDLVQRLASS